MFDRFEKKRLNSVKEYIEKRGITNKKVINAFQLIPRHLFVSEEQQLYAYEDKALPISEGQTISQPYIVALMTEALHLKGHETVLEIGTGSGYQAAILSELCASVISVEYNLKLAIEATITIRSLGIENIDIIVGDGSQCHFINQNFDAIIVTAGTSQIPEEIKEKLNGGGRLVVPVGDSLRFMKLLRLIRNTDDSWEENHLDNVSFVPLLGKKGFK